MAIERIIMTESGSSPEISGQVPGTAVEPNVVVRPETASRSMLDRLLRREPKPQIEVLVPSPKIAVPSEPSSKKPYSISAEYDPKRIGEYTSKQEGNFQVYTDPATGKEIARIPKIAGGAPVPPEGLPPDKGPEWKTSPERGRMMVEEIVRLRTTMSYAERYNAENGPVLSQLYEDLQEYVDTICRIRHERDSWDPYVRDSEGKVTGLKTVYESPLGQESAEESRETYWEVGNYPKYYHITAKNREQFLTAKESFLKMIRDGSLGKSPEAIYEHVNNFKEVFGSEGGRQVRAGNVDREFMTEQRLELEAQLYIFGAEYSNETYNPKSYNQFMTAMALHEGPDRWVRLARSGEGKVAAFTHMFDKEAIMEVFNNSSGERGELDIIAGHFLQDQIKKMVIERGMGIQLKDYNPNDKEYELLRTINDPEARKIREKMLKANLERIGIHIPDEEFKNLYEGFDQGNAHLTNYQHFGSLDETQLRQLPANLRRSIAIGKVQSVLKDDKGITSQRLTERERLIEKIDRLIKTDQLNESDKKDFVYAYDQAEANFDIAFQMQGASGEQVRRGRGFFYVDRNVHVQAYAEAEERSRRIEWILSQLSKGVQLGALSKGNQKFYSGLTDQEKQVNQEFQGLYGIDKKKLPPEQQKSFKIGWMLTELREGRRLDSFDKELKDFYDKLSDEDKHDFVDNVPVYQAENFVQWAVNWTKMKYADDAEFWNNPDKLNNLVKKKLAEEESLVQEIIKENRDAKKKDLENFKAQYRTAKADQARERAIDKIKRHGFEAQLWDGELGPDGKRKPMTVKRPHIFGYDQSGQPVIILDQKGQPIGFGEKDFESGKAIVYDKPAGQRKRIDFESLISPAVLTKRDDGTKVFVEEVAATFQFTQSGDFRSRYTTHTYWGYQGNNRHTLLAPHIFEAARRIKDGLSRPEDEDLLATQLLIVDPTLKRVRRFVKDQQQREITLLQAAVEDSYQGRQKTKRELHKVFLPQDGLRGKMRAGYDNEDVGGMMRFVMGFEELAASQPARFARRLGAEIAIAPIEVDSMGAIWGGHGAMGAINGFADQIKRYSHQGVVGQFGITKFVDQMDIGVDLYNALVGYVDPQTKQHVEGLFMKPTNDNDKLQEFYGKQADIARFPQHQLPFLQEFRQRYGRLERVLKLMRNMYSDVRNAGGALDLKDVDIFLADGKFNPDIESDKSIRNNTGTSRHSEKIFYDAFIDWLLSEKPGGGGEIYPNERYWNSFFRVKLVYFLGDQIETSDDTIQDWFFGKAGL